MALDGAFSHLTIEVTDLDKSEAFYLDVIGLDLLGRDMVASNSPTSLLAMNTRQRVLLVEVPEVPPYPASAVGRHHHGVAPGADMGAAPATTAPSSPAMPATPSI